jgi:hypothetical protein
MLRDLVNLIDPKTALAPVAVALADDTAQVCSIIDGQDAGSITYLISLGTLADANATFAVTMEHGDTSNLADTAAVTAADLIGETGSAGATTATALANASFTFAADGLVRKIGYSGNKRYTRMTITPTGNTGNAPMAVIVLRGHLTSQPAANPPTA